MSNPLKSPPIQTRHAVNAIHPSMGLLEILGRLHSACCGSSDPVPEESHATYTKFLQTVIDTVIDTWTYTQSEFDYLVLQMAHVVLAEMQDKVGGL